MAKTITGSTGLGRSAPAGARGLGDGRSDRRVVAALAALAVGLGMIGAVLAFAAPPRVPNLAPVMLLVGASVLSFALLVDRRRLRASETALAEDNSALRQEFATLIENSDDARRRAEIANEAKSRFLAVVSHEFRTPLNGILGLSGLLLESGLTADQGSYARGVISSGEALLALVDDMLDFSKIEAGRLDLVPEPTDLRLLGQEVVELLAPRAHDKGLDVAADLAAELPAVLVDRMRLRQVLINLVGNAVKFTETGSIVLGIGSAAAAAGAPAAIEFRVVDTGPGIDPASAARIFAEFEQLDVSPARRHGGVGLGLAISRRIVRAMGGDIECLPEARGGSVFRFVLDLPVTNRSVDPPTTDLAGRHILILAPDGAEAAIARDILADAGAEVRLARTPVEGAGLAGAATAAALPYEAVLIDARVAADPADVLAKIRQASGGRLPAAVILQPTARDRLAAFEDGGFDAYLVRPMRRESVLRIVADILTSTGGFRADPVDGQERTRNAPRRGGAGLDVLIAEDNEINALLVRAVVENLGHVATVVADGAAALARATESPGRFTIVLMDLHMPGLDGLATARAIRLFEQAQNAPPATILALTADVLPETRENALAAGVDAVAEKPVTPEMLRRLIAGSAGD